MLFDRNLTTYEGCVDDSFAFAKRLVSVSDESILTF